MTPSRILTSGDYLTDVKWAGQRVIYREKLLLSNVIAELPSFERQQLGQNKYLDQISRLPHKDDQRSIPVAAVSKRYALVQHHEFVSWLTDGARRASLDPRHLETTLWMSEYGERVRLRVQIDATPFEPGDGWPLVLTAECINSVDRSCALEIRTTWVRLVCVNGISLTKDKDVFRMVHDKVWMCRQDPAEFFTEALCKATEEADTFRAWYLQPITLPQIRTWAEKQVAKDWGVQVAARLCLIAEKGQDGIVQRTPERVPFDRQSLRDVYVVPGAAKPSKNLFDVAQALSWIAARRPSVDDQIGWVNRIPAMIEQLKSSISS
jgi:hypothetical protein